jgi:hypothetical protein
MHLYLAKKDEQYIMMEMGKNTMASEEIETPYCQP